MRLFVDTTLIVEAATSEDAATKLRIWCQGHVKVTSSNVLGETYVALTKKKGRPVPLMEPRPAADVVRTAARGHELVPTLPEDVIEGLRLREEHVMGFWDAVNCATALRSGCDRMLTTDLPSGSLRRELVCVNPLDAA